MDPTPCEKWVEIWYHVWDHKGNSVNSHRVTSIIARSDWVIGDIICLIHNFEPVCFEYVVDSCLLDVSANASGFERKKWIEPDVEAQDLVTSETQPLIVSLPDPQTIPFYHDRLLGTARQLLKNLVERFSEYYGMFQTSDELTIHDVLRARCEHNGVLWFFKTDYDPRSSFGVHDLRTREGRQLTRRNLPDVLTEDQWKILETAACILKSVETDPQASKQLTVQLIDGLRTIYHDLEW